MNETRTWHYGLIARWWREFNRAGEEELSCFRSAIIRHGEPALDLACGAGRILIPLRSAGLNVEGCDISPDMLDHCKALAEQAGISVCLYRQAMHELELTQKYRTIFICDSFGIGGSRENDWEALCRIHRHLEPGGALVFNNYLPYANADVWSLWLYQNNEKLPLPWPASGTRKTAGNGDELEIATRIFNFEPREQRLTLQIRASLWQNGNRVSHEESSLQENLYFMPELISILRQAGFQRQHEHTAYTQTPVGPTDTNILITAHA